MRRRDDVPLDEFERTRVHVSVSPYATVGLATFDAVQRDGWLGTPAPLKDAIRARLRSHDVATLAPLATRKTAPPSLIGEQVARPAGMASVLCGQLSPGGATFEDTLEEVAYADPDAFLAATEGCIDDSREWWPLRSDPAGWLRSYACALGRAWEGVEPLWKRATGLLDHEVERVATAVARGVAGDLIASLDPRGSVDDRRWRLPTQDASAAKYRLADDFFVSPMITDQQASARFRDDAGALSALFYPTPGAWRAFGAGELPPPASLEALLGRQRAAILQRLDTPSTCGEIADALLMVPGGVTHHLRSLESAGLIRRTRVGRHVLVARSARGTGLLALYERL